jgi:hypothetical protein
VKKRLKVFAILIQCASGIPFKETSAESAAEATGPLTCAMLITAANGTRAHHQTFALANASTATRHRLLALLTHLASGMEAAARKLAIASELQLFAHRTATNANGQ